MGIPHLASRYIQGRLMSTNGYRSVCVPLAGRWLLWFALRLPPIQEGALKVEDSSPTAVIQAETDFDGRHLNTR